MPRAQLDEQLKQDDLAYLERTNMKEVLQAAMIALLKEKPAQPIPFLINCIEKGPDFAQLDPALGIPVWRKQALTDVYTAMDSKSSRALTLADVREFASAGGASILTDEDLQKVFDTLDFNQDRAIGEEDFLTVYAKATAALGDADFKALVADLTSS